MGGICGTAAGQRGRVIPRGLRVMAWMASDRDRRELHPVAGEPQVASILWGAEVDTVGPGKRHYYRRETRAGTGERALTGAGTPGSADGIGEF